MHVMVMSGRAIVAGNKKLAEEYLSFWNKNFKNNYYIELQRTGREEEELYNQQSIQLATKFSLPVVASNDVRFWIKMNLMHMKFVYAFIPAES